MVEAVASTLIDSNVKNPEQRDVLKEAVHARMAERERTNEVPTVRVYDKEAPVKSLPQEQTHPVMERNIERDVERTR